jgi:hypothetical protein
MTINPIVQADDQVRFSTKNNLFTIPYAIIDQQQIVYGAEMQLQSNDIFVLTKISEQPLLQVGFGEPFTLEMDQSISLRDTNFRLKLTAVTEDSRCPIDAICIREGSVSIVISLYQEAKHLHDYQLTIGDQLITGTTKNDHVDTENFRINLMSVDPISPSSMSISADYKATIVITSLSNN